MQLLGGWVVSSMVSSMVACIDMVNDGLVSR